MAESGDNAVDEWIWSREQEVSNHRPPVVAVRGKLVFKEVDPGSLVFALAKVVAPVVERDLTG